ncbi:MAG: DUF1501 domain-containing protein, partial [Planctomycetota bacterium]
ATMGALYARIAGTNHPDSGMPRYARVLPEAVQPDLKLRRNFETGALPGLTSPGQLGPAYEAFDPAGGGAFQENLQLRLPRQRFDDRRALFQQLDSVKRKYETETPSGGSAFQGANRYQKQAFDMITRGIASAFDLSKEDPRTIERYDTSHLFDMAKLNRYNDMFRSTNLLGKQMLLARRLCEAGCGFVTVSDAGWDMHGNNNSLPRLSGLVPLGHQVDQAVAAFIEDVRERGLSEKILLVVTGEMGRTPRINGRGGRDHYGNLTSLLFAGGGMQMGQVIGRSDSHATRPATEKFDPKNLLATLMHWMFDIGELRLQRDVPSDVMNIVTKDKPIPGLL